MKRRHIGAGIGLWLMMVLLSFTASAASVEWRITHGDDVQDALLVGRVTEAVPAEGRVEFEVVRTVLGIPAGGTFTLTEMDQESLERLAFAPGDGILASVRYAEGTGANGGGTAGRRCYGVYKGTLERDKKIRLDGEYTEYAYIEWFVNTGDYASFGDGDLYQQQGSGEPLLLYYGEGWQVDTLDPVYQAPEVKLDAYRRGAPWRAARAFFGRTEGRVTLLIGAPLLLAGGVTAGWLIARARRRKAAEDTEG